MKNIQFSARFIWALLAFLAPVAVCAQPGNYNTYNQPAWNVQGNSIIGSQWLGTRNSRSLTIKTNNTLAAKIDSLQRLYLYQVDDDYSPDTILTIKSDGEVMKTPYPFPSAQNGLNTIYGSTELGGFLIRNTTVDTKRYGLTFYTDTVKPGGTGTNVGFYFDLNPNQNSVVYNMNNQMNMAQSIDTGAKNFPVFNFYNEMAAPRVNWGNASIVNFHSSFTRAVTGTTPDVLTSTVNNVVNNLTASTYDSFDDYESPQIDRYINLWLGYRRPYANHWDANKKFNKRVELMINSADDTTTITTYADIYLTYNKDINNNLLFGLPTGKWGIYQETAKKNLFRGTTKFDNVSHITLPKGTTAQRPSPTEAADIRFNTDSVSLEIYNGSAWQKILQFTQQPAIPNPAGGSVIDVEARAAIVSILQALRTLGIIAP